MSNVVDNDAPNSLVDKAKWLIAFALIGGSIWGYQHFIEYAEIARFGGFLVAVVVAIFLALTTEKGKAIKTFAYEANIERRKVVWPTQKETRTTTIIVAVMVVVVAIILWAIDSVLVRLVNFVLG